LLDDGHPFLLFNSPDIDTGTLADPFTQKFTPASTIETDLASKSIPASFWVGPGTGIHVKSAFHFAANNNLKRIRGYFGGTQVNFADTTRGLTPNGSGLEIIVETFIWKINDTTGWVINRNSESSDGSFTAGSQLHASYQDNFDFTIANIFKYTGQNGVATANDIERFSFVMKKI